MACGWLPSGGFAASQAKPESVPPTHGQPWTNSLGMKFVPVPGTSVLFCIWETRVRDYAVYAKANRSVDASWQNVTADNAPVSRGPDYPVVSVSWDNAKAFCQWLTKKEREAGRIEPWQEYRLPMDAEWSTALGLAGETGSTPKEKGENKKDAYPWGSGWPPPKGTGNYGKSFDLDSFDHTAPVGSFRPNQLGIYDLSGNVWEWCEDLHNGQSGGRVLRGGSWVSSDPGLLSSSRRLGVSPVLRGDCTGFRVVLVVKQGAHVK